MQETANRQRKAAYIRGLHAGVPIMLGYFAVSFAFGIMAVEGGLSAFEAVLISLTNLTSAGQLAGLNVILAGGGYAEIMLTQLVINLRYSLMSFSLSQKIERRSTLFERLIVSFGITDEIFAVSAAEEGEVSPFFHFGAMSAAVPGWVLGTAAGALLGNVLPDSALHALTVAIYGMFIAIFLPPARKNPVIAGVVVSAMLISSAFFYLPPLRQVSGGFVIIIATLLSAGGAAYFFPLKEDAA